MSAVLALLLVQAGVAPAPVPADDPVKQEILAIGEKMKAWKGGVYKRDGKLTCRLEQGSGDAQVDVIRCAALVRCVSPLAPKMDAISGSSLPEADRKRQLGEVLGSAKPCLDRFHVENVLRLARVRAAKK